MNSRVTATLFLILFVGIADHQTIVVLLPPLIRAFGISVQTAGLLVVFYSVASGAAAFISGALSDRFGRRFFLVGSVLLFAVASGAASQAQSFNQLMVARVLTGLAAGAISTCVIAFAGDWFAYEARGKAIGLIASAYFVAPILGVPVMAYVADHFGWRFCFTGFALLAGGTAFLSLSLPPEKRPTERAPGALASTLRAFVSFAKGRDTSAALLVAFLVSGGLVGFLTYLTEWLHSQFQVSTRHIGMLFMLAGFVSVGGAPLGGILGDRWGKKKISIVSNIMLALALLAVPNLSWGPWLLLAFAVASLGAAFRQGPLTALMTEMVPQTQRGTFIALRNIASQMGISAAVYVGGLLYARHGYPAVTTLCAGMSLLAAVLLARFIAEPRQPREGQLAGKGEVL